jgi:hypothetical protein
MKKLVIAVIVLATIGSSCKKKNDNNTTVDPPVTTDTTVVLSGDIAADMTLDASKKYLLKGFVYVMSGATLHIPAGTILFGDKATKGTLVATRGGKIDAVGTADKPIIFTSSLAAGARREGDWGGIILLGKSTTNATGGEAKIEGGLVPTNGGDEKTYIYYGGNDVTDNSGTLKYVRIEFAGIPYSPDNEINGLTMGAVGSGTTISYVQVYRSGDDSYEWFGGTVNCDHLISTYSWDDDWDTDNGFSGKVQYGVSQRYKTIADQSGSNGFESDNDANGSTNNPKTGAIFANMTVIGPITTTGTSGINANFQHGAQIRRNSTQSIFNSLIIGFPLAGVYIDGTKGTPTIKNVAANTLKFQGNIIAGCAVNWKADATATGTADSTSWIAFKGNTTNTVLTSAADVMMVDPNKYSAGVSATAGTPNYLLQAGSPAMTGAVDLTAYGLQNTTYRGAFDNATDWTKGWSTYSAETNTY